MAATGMVGPAMGYSPVGLQLGGRTLEPTSHTSFQLSRVVLRTMRLQLGSRTSKFALVTHRQVSLGNPEGSLVRGAEDARAVAKRTVLIRAATWAIAWTSGSRQ